MRIQVLCVLDPLLLVVVSVKMGKTGIPINSLRNHNGSQGRVLNVSKMSVGDWRKLHKLCLLLGTTFPSVTCVSFPCFLVVERDENYRASIHNPSHSPWVSYFFAAWDQPDFLLLHLDYPTHRYKRCSKCDSITAREVSHLSLSPCACQAPAVQRFRVFPLPILLNHPHHPHPICTPHTFILYRWDTL